MAKMFYTVDEVKAMLGLNDESLRAMLQEGKLRELHDGSRRVFKASEVEALAAETGTQAPIESPGEASGFTLEMADSTAAGLSTPAGKTAITAEPGDQPSDEDQLTLGGDTQAAAEGAVTQAESAPGILQLDAEGSSGSGLLDLAREGDDTSLGAVMDEIYPGEEETAPGATGMGSGIATGLGTGLASALTPEEEAAEAVAPDQAEAAPYGPDRSSRPFTAVMVPATILLALALAAVTASLQGVTPVFISLLHDKLLYFLIGATGLVLVVFALSAVLSKRPG